MEGGASRIPSYTGDEHLGPLDGLFVFEEAWADEISLGPITLTGVPVEQASPGVVACWGAQFEGSM